MFSFFNNPKQCHICKKYEKKYKIRVYKGKDIILCEKCSNRMIDLGVVFFNYLSKKECKKAN